MIWPSPAVASGRVYIGSDDHKLYCLNASSGGLIWNYITSVRVPDETFTLDNELSMYLLVTILGDVNGDRKVDIFDIVNLANTYGSKKGDSKYKPNYDLDDDNDIDIFDIVIACNHYSESW